MQIYRFSLIFHSISELNKEKQPDFAKNFTDDGRRIGKSRSKLFLLYHFNVLTIVPKSWTSLCEFIHFISRLHVLHWVDTYGWVGWMRRLRWLKESNAMAEGVECDGRRRRMRWLEELNAMAEGVECDGRRRRIRWPKETNPMAAGDDWVGLIKHLMLLYFRTSP